MTFARTVLVATFILFAGAAHAAELVVYKTPWCGCCTGWVERMEEAGFEAEVHHRDDLAPIRADAGVPDVLMGCHTALIDGYAIEGHVPAADIRRLLEMRPDIDGIATPGMPMGSPGMEMGGQRESYQVIAFKDGEAVGVFANH